jgi:hypothetical protein
MKSYTEGIYRIYSHQWHSCAQASEAWPGGDRPATGPGAATLRTRRVRLLSGWGTPSSRCVEAVPPLVVVGAEAASPADTVSKRGAALC